MLNMAISEFSGFGSWEFGKAGDMGAKGHGEMIDRIT